MGSKIIDIFIKKNLMLRKRRIFVSKMVKNGLSKRVIIKKAAQKFNCHVSAIYADLRSIQNKDLPNGCKSATGIRMKIFRRDKFICQYCGYTGDNLVIEHIVPKYYGGKTESQNLVVACASCNSIKCRDIWVPKNFNQISDDQYVISNAVKDFR